MSQKIDHLDTCTNLSWKKVCLSQLWRVCFVLSLGLGLTLATLTSLKTYAQSHADIITTQGKYLVRNGTRFEVHGMNYYPKDYAWDRFWTDYGTISTTQISTELNLAQALGINTVRVFLPYNLFNNKNQIYLTYLKDFIDNQLQSRDMVAIVTLFDFYPSYSAAPYSSTDYITSTSHISAVVNALGVANPNVLAWDIKNELDRDYESHDLYHSPGKDSVVAWVNQMISYTRQLDPYHLITIGFYGTERFTGTLPCYGSPITDTLVYSPAIAAEFSSAVDFVSMHYFLPERCYEGDLQMLQALVTNKPIVLEEFGLHTMTSGPDPHTETEQAAYYNALLSVSEAYGIVGYLFWTLNDFSYILTGTEETHYCQGILRNSEVSACQVTPAVDYSEKPAAGTTRQHYSNQVAYLDLFDSWVVSNTDKPPAGWSDNWDTGGGVILRGYQPSNDPFYRFWSKDQGKVAFSKFETGTTSLTGTATSPMLVDINVGEVPILMGQVYSYSLRDAQSPYASDSSLYLGVKEGSQVTQLLTITPGTSLPYNFLLNLRRPPLSWNGTHSFQIIFEFAPGNGYSASYEFDWIGVRKAIVYLPLIMKNDS